MKKQMKAKLLELYRNGQAASKPDEGPEQPTPQNASRSWRPKRQHREGEAEKSSGQSAAVFSGTLRG